MINCSHNVLKQPAAQLATCRTKPSAYESTVLRVRLHLQHLVSLNGPLMWKRSSLHWWETPGPESWKKSHAFPKFGLPKRKKLNIGCDEMFDPTYLYLYKTPHHSHCTGLWFRTWSSLVYLIFVFVHLHFWPTNENDFKRMSSAQHFPLVSKFGSRNSVRSESKLNSKQVNQQNQLPSCSYVANGLMCVNEGDSVLQQTSKRASSFKCIRHFITHSYVVGHSVGVQLESKAWSKIHDHKSMNSLKICNH